MYVYMCRFNPISTIFTSSRYVRNYVTKVRNSFSGWGSLEVKQFLQCEHAEHVESSRQDVGPLQAKQVLIPWQPVVPTPSSTLRNLSINKHSQAFLRNIEARSTVCKRLQNAVQMFVNEGHHCRLPHAMLLGDLLLQTTLVRMLLSAPRHKSREGTCLIVLSCPE